MIDLYTWKTPNGYKVPIMLEECHLPYKIIPVDISKNIQFTPEFIKINPNSKIPAIIDHDESITIFESGAILIYLAEKTGKFLPQEIKARYQVIEWLMIQLASIGPMFGQFFHFSKHAPEEIPYAIERYRKESLRLLSVLDKQLSNAGYIAGDYSIADIAFYPWINGIKAVFASEISSFSHLTKWLQVISEREAVKRAMKIEI